jgi:hypothetical protein
MPDRVTTAQLVDAVASGARAQIRNRLRTIVSSNVSYIKREVLIEILRREINEMAEQTEEELRDEDSEGV